MANKKYHEKMCYFFYHDIWNEIVIILSLRSYMSTLYFEIAYLVVFLAVHRRWTLAAKQPFTRSVYIESVFETVPGFSFVPVPGFSFVPLILVISRKTEYPREITHQTHGI